MISFSGNGLLSQAGRGGYRIKALNDKKMKQESKQRIKSFMIKKANSEYLTKCLTCYAAGGLLIPSAAYSAYIDRGESDVIYETNQSQVLPSQEINIDQSYKDLENRIVQRKVLTKSCTRLFISRLKKHSKDKNLSIQKENQIISFYSSAYCIDDCCSNKKTCIKCKTIEYSDLDH